MTKWKRIIVTRSISIIPCVIISLLTVDEITHLNFWCNIIKAIQLPFALLPILHFTSSKRIMGSFRNNLLLKIICYFISVCVLAINVYFIINMIVETRKLWSYILGSALVVYIFFVCFFVSVFLFKISNRIVFLRRYNYQMKNALKMLDTNSYRKF